MLNSSATPVQADLPVGLMIESIDAGNFHNLAIASTDELWGWGSAGSGSLGPGFTSATVSQPTLLETPSEIGFYALNANKNHSLALSKNGAIPFAWGRNDTGQLGDGSMRSVRSDIQEVVFNRD
jgi:alpha-tubulin suppressor-like RCC1 family protein